MIRSIEAWLAPDSVMAVTSAPVSILKVVAWLLMPIVASHDVWLPVPMVLR